MVRRPLMYGALAFASAITICRYKEIICAAAVAAVMLTVYAIMKKTENSSKASFAVFVLFFAAGTVNYFVYGVLHGETVLNIGENTILRGKAVQVNIEEDEENTRRMRIKMKIHMINGQNAERKECVLIDYYVNADEKSEDYYLIPGDVIDVSGIAKKPSGRRNPGCFDYSLYLESLGIKAMINADNVSVYSASGQQTLTGRMHMVREAFTERLADSSSRETALMMGAIMFGKKDNMDEELVEEFRKNGTAHILAVSGLHIGIIYGFISRLWRWKKGWVYFIVVMMFFVCYMAAASFTPSVVRAVIMVGLHAFARITNRRYDLNSAAFAASIAMLARNPMYLFNTGFQMSFLAVLTMALVIPYFKKVYNGIFLASLSIQIGLMPYMAYTFNYISPGAVFLNVPVVFLAGLMVPAGLCSVAAMYLWAPAFKLLAGLLAGLCEILKILNHVTAVEGIFVFQTVSPDIRFLAFYYISMICFLSEEGRLLIIRRRKKLLAGAILAVVSASCFFGAVNGNEFKKADVVFVDVGQGDCVHFRTEDGRSYMIDGGGSVNYNVGKKVLTPYLLKNGVKKLDGIFVTHLHTDHYKGAAELCRQGMAKELFVYEGNKIKGDELAADTGLAAENIHYLYKGQTVKLSQDVSVRVLWPERKNDSEYKAMMENEEDENLSSLILKVTVDGGSFIVTGDVDEECQNRLRDQWRAGLRCDVLKVAHHGSKYSYCEDFVRTASPQFAVFQVGKNNFGHPDKGVVENYRGNGIMVYRNDEDGAVAFDFKEGKATEVMTVRKER